MQSSARISICPFGESNARNIKQSKKCDKCSRTLQDLASSFLHLLDLLPIGHGGLGFVTLVLDPDSCVDGEVKDFLNTLVLLGRTFDVDGTHLRCNLLALFLCDWREPLGAEQFDAGTFCSQVRFESD